MKKVYTFSQFVALPDNAHCEKCKRITRPLYSYGGNKLFCDGCRP